MPERTSGDELASHPPDHPVAFPDEKKMIHTDLSKDDFLSIILTRRPQVRLRNDIGIIFT